MQHSMCMTVNCPLDSPWWMLMSFWFIAGAMTNHYMGFPPFCYLILLWLDSERGWQNGVPSCRESCVYIFMYIYINMRVCMYVYVCIYIYIYIYIRVCVFVCVWRCVLMFKRAHVHACVYLYINEFWFFCVCSMTSFLPGTCSLV